MKIFVIHRFNDRRRAKAILKELAKRGNMRLNPIFLDSYTGDVWKQEALDAIQESEAVIVFDPKACEESSNTEWEIKQVEDAKKPIIEVPPSEDYSSSANRLRMIYDLQEEFEVCFSKGKDSFDLYKLMIESSESLILRRQRTNAFFITVIGGLLAIAGLLVEAGAISDGSIAIIYGFSAVGLLLCKSWHNLIENYGKLNKAKFDVILRLEKDLSAQIYSAEWIALGKGMRPDKYRSFTSTEQNVPLYFGLLILVLTGISVVWQILN